MTEDEAKTKWCPFVRSLDESDAGPANRYVGDPGHIRPWNACVGSACMAWRWEEVPRPARESRMVARTASLDGEEPDLSHRLPGKPATAGNGYCGLAGAPR